MKFAVCLLVCMVALAASMPNQKSNAQSNKFRPQEWMKPSELESMPSLEEFTMQDLEKMPAEKGAKIIKKFYHLSQIKFDLTPSFVPSPSNIPVSILKNDGSKVNTNLNQLVETLKQWNKFGEEEVTIFMTGLPETTETVAKANNKLIQAYKWRYSGLKPELTKNMDLDSKVRTSSEEDYVESSKNTKTSRGNLIVIDLGSTITSFKRFALLDVHQTGAMIGKMLVDLTNEVNVPQEIIHIVGQGIGAHVAGAAARQYTRLTGHKLRRITALDPSKIFAKNPERLTGLARGDAEFVDVIHTSANGMGTRTRLGDIDFFPNGPSVAVPGTDNVVEASMRATRYYAETVRPGNERNFPAVAANSLDEYIKKNGHGKRTYMGIDVDFDLEGDYMLEVNPKSPFGKSARAEKQTTYHGVHRSWKNQKNQDYE